MVQSTRCRCACHVDEVEVDEVLVCRLLASQLPHLADRPLAVVEPWGTDNAIWRLGDDLVVRLPRIHWATEQVDRDARWLPHLAPHLPVAVPEPIAIGEPEHGYPYRWAVHRWLPGQSAALDRFDDPITFALDLAELVRSLQQVPTDGTPAHAQPGPATRGIRRVDRRSDPPSEPPGRRRGRRRGLGGRARRAAARRSGGLGPRRSRGQLPGPRRPPVRCRRLGVGVRRRSSRRCPSRVVAPVHG